MSCGRVGGWGEGNEEGGVGEGFLCFPPNRSKGIRVHLAGFPTTETSNRCRGHQRVVLHFFAVLALKPKGLGHSHVVPAGKDGSGRFRMNTEMGVPLPVDRRALFLRAVVVSAEFVGIRVGQFLRTHDRCFRSLKVGRLTYEFSTYINVRLRVPCNTMIRGILRLGLEYSRQSVFVRALASMRSNFPKPECWHRTHHLSHPR